MRVSRLALVAVFSLLATLSMRADTTYSYTGQLFSSFNQVTPVFSNTQSVTGSFTVASPLAANLSGASLTPTSFSFTDGLDTLTNTNAQFATFTRFDTDATGNLVHWDVELSLGNILIVTNNYLQIVIPFGAFPQALDIGSNNSNSGNVYSNPGTWSVMEAASPVPEPSTLGLLGTGLLGLVGVARRRLIARS